MAQLKELLVNGPSRFLSKLFAKEIQADTLNNVDADVIADHPSNTELHIQPGEREKWTPDLVLSTSSEKPIANKAVANAGFATIQYVQGLVGGNKMKILRVDALPTTDIDTNTMYLVADPDGVYPNLYLEYINYTGTDTGWEYVGNNAIRLEDYYKKNESNNLFALKIDVGNKTDLATTNKDSLVEAVNEVFTSGSNTKANVVAAVTAKGQSATNEDTWEALVSKIGAIKSVLTGNANATMVLSGATFYSNNPESKLTGSMSNHGAKTAALNCGQSYTIPKGYHNGSGKITANGLASQTPGTATTNTILQGYTAWVNGAKITGSIPNYLGAITQIDAVRIANGRFEVAVAYGVHGYNWNGSYEYLTFAQVSNTIGLTADKIVKGNTILGIAGAAEPTKTVSGITISIIATAANGTVATVSAPYAGWYMLFKSDQDATFSSIEFKNVNAGTTLTKDSNRLNSSFAARAYICYLNITLS